MNQIRNKVRQAQRRLWFNRWLGQLGWSLAGAAGLFVVFVLIVRLSGLLQDEGRVMRWAIGCLAGAGLIASLLWTYLTRDSLSLAAARLDEAAGLKERLSTALHFETSADPFAKAVVADAGHVSRLVTPKLYLPVRVPASASYAGGAFFAALMFFWLFPAVDLSGRQAALAEETQKQQEIKKVQVEIKPIVDRLRNLQEKHPEIKKETFEADPLQTAKLDKPNDYKREAIKQVNAVSAKLDKEKSQASLAKVEEFKSMLRRLAAQPTPPSMVGKLSKSLAQGDFKAAQLTLESIRMELNKEPKSAEDKAKAEQLRQELKKVSDQLGKIAESNNKMKDQLRQMNLSEAEIKKIIDCLSKGDQREVAKQLANKGLTKEQIEKTLKQMEKSTEACKACCKLAKNLAEAATKKGSGSEGCEQAGQLLSEMKSLQQKNEELNAAAMELKDIKEQLGGICESGGPDTGPGIGRGTSPMSKGGVAPIPETAFTKTPERASLHTTNGAIIDQRFVQGEQYKGEVTNEFVEAALGVREDLTDVNRQKTQPRHIKLRQAQYFKHVESDLPKDKVDAVKKKLDAQASAHAASKPAD